MRRAWVLVLLLACARTAEADAPRPEEITIPGKAGRLQAWLWKPPGRGPFPVVVYNHGSEQAPIAGTESNIGPFFVANGHAVLFPHRRGAGKSEGRYWRDGLDPWTDAGKRGAIERLVEENDDVVTAIAWARAQPWAKKDEIAVAGCSFGGIHTLLTAEREVPGLRAALDFAGGAMSWDGSVALRERLLEAVGNARVPVFFLQAENDFNTAPSTILAGAMQQMKRPHRVRIYPPFGTTNRQGHGGFCMRATDVWGADVLEFLKGAGVGVGR